MLHALVSAVLTLAASLAPASAPAPAPAPPSNHVLAISIDGLNVDAIRNLGRSGAPALHRMLRQGAGTLNARTEYELSNTLPNHTSMVTGRRITAAEGGHGVTWNDDRPGTTVQAAAGHAVASVFSAVHRAGGDTALYAMKSKFSLLQRSWPRAVHTYVKTDAARLVSLATADLRDGPATFTFVHLALPDSAGHEHGGMSEEYLDAVGEADGLLATLLDAVADQRVTVVLTADHGFAPGKTSHSDQTAAANYTIPFLVWGDGVARRADLYALNRGYRDPGTGRPAYARKRQPIRNGDVANLAAGLLDLKPVRGSGIGKAPPLVVAR